MAVPTRCQTPDAVFHVKIGDREICAAVDLPFPLGLSEEEAAVLEANVHNALELALAPYFRPVRELDDLRARLAVTGGSPVADAG